MQIRQDIETIRRCLRDAQAILDESPLEKHKRVFLHYVEELNPHLDHIERCAARKVFSQSDPQLTQAMQFIQNRNNMPRGLAVRAEAGEVVDRSSDHAQLMHDVVHGFNARYNAFATTKENLANDLRAVINPPSSDRGMR